MSASGDIVEIDYPGPMVTRRFVEQVMHNCRIALNDITTGNGLRETRIAGSNTMHIELTDSNDADEDASIATGDE